MTSVSTGWALRSTVSPAIARRRGQNKARVALGNTQLKVYHKLLSNPGMRYEDLGPDYYEQQAAIRRKIASTSARSKPSASTSPSPAPHKNRARQPRNSQPA